MTTLYLRRRPWIPKLITQRRHTHKLPIRLVPDILRPDDPAGSMTRQLGAHGINIPRERRYTFIWRIGEHARGLTWSCRGHVCGFQGSSEGNAASRGVDIVVLWDGGG